MPLYYQFKNKEKRVIKRKTFRAFSVLLFAIAFSCLFYTRLKEGLLGNRGSDLILEKQEEGIIQEAGLVKLLPSQNKAILEEAAEPDSSKTVLEGELTKGANVYNCLARAGVSENKIQLIISKFKPLFNFSVHSRPGDIYRLILSTDGDIERFEYQRGPIEKYCLTKDTEENYRAWQEDIRLKKYWVRINGVIKDSLFNTFQREGYPVSLAVQYAEILEWKIDFQHEVRDGDRFALVVERFYKGDEPIDYGRIVAAMYEGKMMGDVKGFYFEQGDSHGDYFNEDGTSLRSAFLKAPLSYKYISSGFSYHRKHPILGRVRTHFGIDFAAPYGSPVWAVADGVVISKTYDRSNGNQIKLKHANSYITYYNHLSKFARGLRRGDRVRQKEIIGYVGTTGLSTGPHLDYRVKKGNSFINPLKAEFPSGDPLKKSMKPQFELKIADIDPILTGNGDLSMFLVAEVSSTDLNLSLL